MEIVAGMVLMCTMIIDFSLGEQKAFVKDVETKVHFITPKGDAFIQYKLKGHKSFIYGGSDRMYDVQHVDDMKRVDHMDCRKVK